IGVLVLNVTGDFSQSGGSFDFASGGANTTRTPALKLSGDFSQTGSASMITSTGDADIVNGTITFNKSGTHTFSIATQANLTYTNFIIASNSILALNSSITLSSSSTNNWAGNFTVNNGGTLDAGTHQIISSTGASAGTNNDFILNSGATIITADADGIQSGTNGTISASIANRTYSSRANYSFNGSVTQNSGIITTTPTANQVSSFTVNNTAGSTGVTLQQSFAITDTCFFTAGLITTTSTNLLIFNDNSIASGANNNTSNPSYVNGPVRKIGNDAFTFPVGKSGAGYHYCGISAPGDTSDVFDAEYIRASAAALGSITASGLKRVSNCEYWNLNEAGPGSPTVNVTLSWNGLSNCNGAAYVSDLATLTVAHFGTSWDCHGSSSNTGNAAAGDITRNGISVFSPFAIGSTSETTNPLPVKFTSVKAYPFGDKNIIEWANATESDLKQYQIEKSVNGYKFSTINTVAARGNANGREDYFQYDNNAASAIIWYRINAIGVSGSSSYSQIVKVDRSNKDETKISLYPNPVVLRQFTLDLFSVGRESYIIRIVNNSGQQVYSTNWVHTGGTVSRTIELPACFTKGFYYLQVTSAGNKTLTSGFIVQ
ncbi:MAG TPA: T9SS type A sorting domain-containing protein, partial [Chitinophagaceae bacterium]|nr:T9SS type A sorting domain-containing protein [Chitinophagaceae bacterium]